MNFTKMHGCGNDYIFINCIDQNVPDRSELSKRVSDRHFGIGSDGLICICPSEIADFKMDMYNADGSNAQICGNGIRCLGKFVREKGLCNKDVIDIETRAGVKRLWLNIEDDKVNTVRVSMGSPNFKASDVPVVSDQEEFTDVPLEVAGNKWIVSAVSVGNPHAVTFVQNVDWLDLHEIGPEFENHPLFPERVNTEFIQIVDENTIKMRVWERGSGETLACGSGSCAAVAVAAHTGRTADRVKVLLLGGELLIEWNRDENIIYMTGPAEHVFDGTFIL